MGDSAPNIDEFNALFAAHRDALRRFVERDAAALLRHETADDLVQAIYARALDQLPRFSYRGADAYFGWLAHVARQHFADRHDYWTAARRQAGRVLRVAASSGDIRDGATSAVQVPAGGSGPATFAVRREQLEIAARAVQDLAPRDQAVVRALTRGASIEELARELGVSYDAAEKAKSRALERFKKAFEALAGREPGPPRAQ